MALNEDIATVARQENTLHFDSFDEDVAWRLGELLRGWAARDRSPVVIDVRRFDRQLFYAALPGSVPDNAEWVRRKVNAVTRFGRSSYGLGLELKQKDATLESRYGLSLRDYAVHGGSFPLVVRRAGPIGCVTVSGLPQREDHSLVVRALCNIIGWDNADLALGPEEGAGEPVRVAGGQAAKDAPR